MLSCGVGAGLVLPSPVRDTVSLAVPPTPVPKPMRALPGNQCGLDMYYIAFCLEPAGLELFRLNIPTISGCSVSGQPSIFV